MECAEAKSGTSRTSIRALQFCERKSRELHTLNREAFAAGFGQPRSGPRWAIQAKHEQAGRLLRAQGFDGVDGGGAARGQVAGQESRRHEANGDGTVRQGIDWAHPEEQGGYQPHQDNGHNQPADSTDARKPESVANEHSRESLLLRAEGHANADLAPAL